MNEPDVTLTDYLLALESCIFWKLLSSVHHARIRQAFRWFFALVALSAILGGSSHGFFEDESTKLYQLIWAATLASLGLVALAEVRAGIALWSNETTQLAHNIAFFSAAVLVVAYVLYVFTDHRPFRVAIFVYLPASCFLLFAFLRAYTRSRHRAHLLGALGVCLTFVAAAMQQLQIGLHPRFFDHNALYHVIQGIALLLIYRAISQAFLQGREL